MSNFLHKGKRIKDKKDNKEIKKRKKSIDKILLELDSIIEPMLTNEKEITKDNLKEIASKYTDIKIGKYEELILLSKIKQIKDANKNKSNN